MPFAAIYVPDFAVEAIVRAEPELRERALAVVEGTPPLLRVVGVNERARQCGVEIGMTALQAEERLSTLDRNDDRHGRETSSRAPLKVASPTRTATQPNARAGNPSATAARRQYSAWQIRRRSPIQEQAAHAALLDCACTFSPRVEDTRADTVLLDLAGLERLFGEPAKLARDLARRASEVGLEANVAIAANPDAAVQAARGFPGVTLIPAGKEAERLGELSIDVLAPAEEMIETLDRWGVRNFRSLGALPEVAVAQRLGQEGVTLQKLARGAGSRPLVVAEPPLTFEEAVELEYPVALLEPLAFMLNRMLEQLCARLASRALAAQELRLRLELDSAGDIEILSQQNERTRKRVLSQTNADERGSQKSEIADQKSVLLSRGGIFTRTIKLPVPMLDAKVFLKLLQLDLQAHPPGAPILKLWLAAEPAEPRRSQSGLFVPITPEPEKLELTLARIKAVVSRRSSVAGNSHGDEELRVGSPEVLDTHCPDTFRMRRFDPFTASKPPAQATAPPQSISDRQSPIVGMRIFRPPLAVAVEVRDGGPRRVLGGTQNARSEVLRDVTGEVVWAAGPWRDSGDWWTEHAWSREEWDVAIQNEGAVALYRMFRDDRSGAWFVEAEYD